MDLCNALAILVTRHLPFLRLGFVFKPFLRWEKAFKETCDFDLSEDRFQMMPRFFDQQDEILNLCLFPRIESALINWD